MLPADGPIVSLMKGSSRDDEADVRGHHRSGRGPSRAGRHRQRPQPRPRDRGQAARRVAAVASSREDMAEAVAAACAAPYFRPYTSTDVIGTEVAGGQERHRAGCRPRRAGVRGQFKASIITRGLAETIRLGTALGGQAVTFAGLAGVGDLIATCMSPLSRNHSFGGPPRPGLHRRRGRRPHEADR